MEWRTGEDLQQAFRASGCAPFPAYRDPPGEPNARHSFRNPAIDIRRQAAGPFAVFQIWTWTHSTKDVEWPIAVHIPTALRGFRRSVGLSQAKFAAALHTSRLNIERWETGKSKPFRGHTLALMTLLRPLVEGPWSAGQFLNFAAEVVGPRLTRPTAVYLGRSVETMLVDGRDDHRDLAPALLDAFTSAEILISVDSSEEELAAQYIPLVGARAMDRQTSAVDDKLLSVARRLHESDRKLWLAIGERLAVAKDRHG